jgi:hypothetical protein
VLILAQGSVALRHGTYRGNHEDKLSFLASVEKDSVAMSYVNHEHLSQQIESEKVQQQQNAAQEQQESQEEDIDISFSR